MDYLWLKALHIIAAMTWVSGMLVAGVTLGAATGAHATLPTAFVAAVSRWDQRVTTPAMLAVWALGLSLAYQGGWFPHGWLGAKIALVLLLSGAHGVISGSLRRLAAGRAAGAGIIVRAPPLFLAAVAVIILLVVIKPSMA